MLHRECYTSVEKLVKTEGKYIPSDCVCLHQIPQMFVSVYICGEYRFDGEQ